MGLLKAEPELFSQAWVDENKDVPESAMNCAITITRITGTGAWDPMTGTVSSTTTTVLTTKARIQPLRSSVPKEVPGNDTFTQVMLASYPVEHTAEIRVGDIVKVTSAPRNPDLLRRPFKVKEYMDSGNILERTIQCEVDLRG